MGKGFGIHVFEIHFKQWIYFGIIRALLGRAWGLETF